MLFSATKFVLICSSSNWKLITHVCLVAQLCPTLCNPMDWSPPGSSVHGISQARILEWVAMPSSRGSSWPRDRTYVSCITGRFFTLWATWGAQKKEGKSAGPCVALTLGLGSYMTLPSPVAPLYFPPPTHVPSQHTRKPTLGQLQEALQVWTAAHCLSVSLVYWVFSMGHVAHFPIRLWTAGLPFWPQSSLLLQLRLSDSKCTHGFQW